MSQTLQLPLLINSTLDPKAGIAAGICAATRSAIRATPSKTWEHWYQTGMRTRAMCPVMDNDDATVQRMNAINKNPAYGPALGEATSGETIAIAMKPVSEKKTLKLECPLWIPQNITAETAIGAHIGDLPDHLCPHLYFGENDKTTAPGHTWIELGTNALIILMMRQPAYLRQLWIGKPTLRILSLNNDILRHCTTARHRGHDATVRANYPTRDYLHTNPL